MQVWRNLARGQEIKQLNKPLKNTIMKTIEFNEQDIQLLSTTMFLECERIKKSINDTDMMCNSDLKDSRLNKFNIFYANRISLLKRINNLLKDE